MACVMSLIRKLIKYWNKEHRADDGLCIMMRTCYINLIYCVLLYLAARCCVLCLNTFAYMLNDNLVCYNLLSVLC